MTFELQVKLRRLLVMTKWRLETAVIPTDPRLRIDERGRYWLLYTIPGRGTEAGFEVSEAELAQVGITPEELEQVPLVNF